MLTKEQVSKLLNRSLTTAENTNFSTYLNIAVKYLETLLCADLNERVEDRTFDVRDGYRTIFTDPFTQINTITVNGVEKAADTYSVRQFDKRSGSWYNSVVFKQHLDRDVEEITINADWGFTDCLPSDLQMLLAQLFNLVTELQTADDRVKSKKIEDFQVTYKDAQTYDEFVASNASVVRQYSVCSLGDIQNGHIYSL